MAVNRNPTHIPKKSYPMLSSSKIKSVLLSSGIDSELANSLTDALRKILDQQAVDERLNYDVIEKGLANVGASKVYATIVVAPSNHPATAAEVDYKCAGSGDQATITSALVEAAALSFSGARVLLLAGEYVFSGPVTVSEGVIIEGEGFDWYNQSGTVINQTTDSFIITGEGVTLKNLLFTGGDLAVEARAGNFTLENLAFDSVDRPIVLTQVGNSTNTYVWYACAIRDCIIGNSCGVASGYMIDANWTNDNSLYLLISGLLMPGLFLSGDGALRLKTTGTGGGGVTHIIGNDLRMPTLIDDMASRLVFANNLHDNSDIEIRNAGYVAFNSNSPFGDLTFNTVTALVAAGNICLGTYTETAVTTVSKAANIGM